MSTYIQNIGTAVPHNAISKNEVLKFMIKAHEMDGPAARELEILYRATGIQKRHSVLDDYSRTDSFTFYPNTAGLNPFPDTAIRQEKYRKEAVSLSMKAINDCMNGTDVSKITHLITVSCTGMYAPGLDIDIVRELGLNPEVKRTAINFMGCYAAFNALKVADAFCMSSQEVSVLVVCTELCTLHFQKAPTEDNLLASALFSDGSAAVLLSNRASGGNCLRIDQFHATIDHSGQEEMAWEIGNTGFEMKLSASVTEFLEKKIGILVNKLKEVSGIDEFTHYALHPGGRRILQVLEHKLGISKDHNRYSHNVLKNFGNMSSATILFVLKAMISDPEIMKDHERKILSLAFGPGLTLESMILSICSNE